MTTSEMKALAKERLKGKRGTAIGVMLLSGALTMLASGITSFLGPLAIIVTMLVSGPLTLGMTIFFLHIYSGEQENIGDLFEGFKTFSGAFMLMFLKSIFTFLWSLLFVIPGIIKSYSYSMSFYILAENPEISGNEALKRSKEMMNGHKMELFVFWFSFIGWIFFGMITLGIGFLYVMPYIDTATAVFYANLAHDGVIQTGNTQQDTGWEQNVIEKQDASFQPGATEVLSTNMVNQTIVLNQQQMSGIFTGVGGSLLGISYTLPDGEEYCIGRDAGQCGIVITDENASVSRLHCMIRYAADQSGYYVTDYSSNGTFIDGIKMIKGQIQFVHRGVTVSLGNQINSFRLE